MPDEVKYDRHYRDDPAACGAPFQEFERFCGEIEVGAVLDLGCGQGRDALMFARQGHRVTGVDLSSVGIDQMLEAAREEELEVEGIVADITAYRPDALFDIVILDRVLHMLAAEERISVFEVAMEAVAPGGHLLVAEGPKNMAVLREHIEQAEWSLVHATRNRLIARRTES